MYISRALLLLQVIVQQFTARRRLLPTWRAVRSSCSEGIPQLARKQRLLYIHRHYRIRWGTPSCVISYTHTSKFVSRRLYCCSTNARGMSLAEDVAEAGGNRGSSAAAPQSRKASHFLRRSGSVSRSISTVISADYSNTSRGRTAYIRRTYSSTEIHT